MICVYKITSPTNRVYVGSTTNVNARWRKYKKLQCISQRKLHSSFLKYGVENHIFEIITECSLDDIFQLETHWGTIYNVLDKKAGLNLMLPKDGDVYGGHSKEMAFNSGRFKKGQASLNKGVPMTEENREKLHNSRRGIPSWNKGVPMTEESKLNISIKKKGKQAANKGFKCNDEIKKKISESKKGTIAWNKGVKTGIAPQNARLILDFNTGVYYYSSVDASNYTGIKRTTINNMLNGKSKNKTPLRYV